MRRGSGLSYQSVSTVHAIEEQDDEYTQRAACEPIGADRGDTNSVTKQGQNSTADDDPG